MDSEELKKKINDTIDNISQQRDEVKLQIHLAKKEAKDEWDNLENKWDEIKHKAEKVKTELKDTSKDVGSAIDLLAVELKKGYEKIKKLF